MTVALTRVSTGAGGVEAASVDFVGVSPDGRFVLFSSTSTDLVPGDTNGQRDVFLKNVQTGETIRIVGTGGVEFTGGQTWNSATLFNDGRRVVFQSQATNAVPGDVNGVADIFVKDLVTGVVAAVSADAGGTLGNSPSSLNFNAFGQTAGDLVVFSSTANNLVAGDSNGTTDVFVKNVVSGAISRISTDAGGGQVNGASSDGRITADGAKVVFVSFASNLVPGDGNGFQDVFVKTLATGAVERVSTSSAGVEANAQSSFASFSPDGTKVLFVSNASNLVANDTNGAADVFIKDLATGEVQRVSTDAAGAQLSGASNNASFSADGAKVLFFTAAANAVPGDTNGFTDAFVKTLATGAIERVSVTPDGVQGNASTSQGLFLADGSVVFMTNASNLVVGDTNGGADVFRATLFVPPPPTPPPADDGNPGNDHDGGLPPRGPILDPMAAAVLRYLNPSLQPLPATVTTPAGQVLNNPILDQRAAVQAVADDYTGVPTVEAARDRIVDMADATTTVALMNYQFFTGRLPSETGLDFLVNSAANPADLNDGYYAGMTVENRYINFAVNLGKLGEGRAAFTAAYGALSINEAAAKAYQEVFGVAPSASKVSEILSEQVAFGGRAATRADYLAALGGDGLGAKAAMVGFLLSEAAKADIGPYSVMAENFLYDLSDGVAAFGADAHIYLGAGPRSVGLIGVG
jgi:Tol biopolymer transport system component